MQGYNAIVVFDEMADKNPVSNTQTKYRRRHSSSMEYIAKFLCTLTQKNLKKVNHFGRTNKKFRYLIVIHTSTVYRTPKLIFLYQEQ